MPLTQNRFHYLTVYIRQTEVATLKTVDQSSVIESQLLENCGLNIMHIDKVLHNVEAQFVHESLNDAGP